MSTAAVPPAPRRRLRPYLVSLERSRARWKERAVAARTEVRALRRQLRRVTASRAHWRTQAFRTQPPTGPGPAPKSPQVGAARVPAVRPARHRYDLALIGGLLTLVVRASLSLRAAARTCILGTALAAAPAPATGRLWLLRLGLHRLRGAAAAADWCWLVDHTALLGRQRLLVVLGVRQAAWAEGAARGEGALRFGDVQVLHLAVVADPDAAQLQAQLDALAERTGVPQAILSDRGADVAAGIRRFRATRPAVADVADAKHYAANRLKALLQGQPAWAAFQTALGQTRAALQQTEWAFVVPPALRTKSRYLNLDVLLRWAAKAQALLALPTAQLAQRGEVARLEQALGWLRGLEATLAQWREWLALTEEAVGAVRAHGLHAGAAADLAARLGALAHTESGRALAEQLVTFVREQQGQVPAGGRLPGSTEVLESLFGRLKVLQQQHSRGGVTALALALPALLGEARPEEVAAALASCSTAAVRRWVQEHVTPNIQQQRCWLRSLVPPQQRKKKRTKEGRAAA